MTSYRSATTNTAASQHPLLAPLGTNTTAAPVNGVQPATFGSTGGAQFSSFGPDNNLIGTAITPGQSAQTQQAGQYAMGAAGQVAGQQFSPFQSVGPFTSAQSYAGIAPTQVRQAGTTDPTAAYNYQTQAAGALNNGSMAAGASGLVGLGTYSSPGVSDGGVGGSYSFGGFGADTTGARGLTLQALEAAMSGPERVQLAQDAYDQFVERSQPQFDQDQRALGQRATALGRTGSGMVNSEFADLGTARERELSLARRELSTETAGQTLGDRLARVAAGESVSNSFGNLDLGGEQMKLGGAQLDEQAASRRANASAANASAANQAAGIRLGANQGLIDSGMKSAEILRGLGNDRFNMDSTITGERGRDADRGMATDQFNTGLAERGVQFGYNADRDTYNSRVSERDAARADEYGQAGYNLDRLGALDNFYRGRESSDRADRDEYRTERGYQAAAERQAIDDEYRSAEFDEWLRNSQYNRGMGYTNAGYSGSPASALANASNYYGNQAAGSYSAIGPMMQYLAAYNSRQPTARAA